MPSLQAVKLGLTARASSKAGRESALLTQFVPAWPRGARNSPSHHDAKTLGHHDARPLGHHTHLALEGRLNVLTQGDGLGIVGIVTAWRGRGPEERVQI